MKPLQLSTKPLHRGGRPSIDKTQVSKPFAILAHDDKELFEVITSGSLQTRAQRTPKVADKKVRINAPKPVESYLQPEPKVIDATPRSWYTPVPPQSPTEGTLQRAASDPSPQTTPSKTDIRRSQRTREFKGHLRVESEPRRDGVEATKRRVEKHTITYPDCPWIGSDDAPYGYLVQHKPVRSATGGSCGSEKTAVDDETIPHVGFKMGGWIGMDKPADQTINPTVRLISKPLPEPPSFDAASSRSSASTGSVYSDGDQFPLDKLLNMFPVPPKDPSNVARLRDRKVSNPLPTLPVSALPPNPSSNSVATVTPRPLPLKTAPKPKAAAVVHQSPRARRSFPRPGAVPTTKGTTTRQTPRTNRPFARVKDSLAVKRGRARSKASVKGNTHTSKLVASLTPASRRGPAAAGPPRSQKRFNKPVGFLDLLFPHRFMTAQDFKLEEEARVKYEEMREEDQRREDFPADFAVIREMKLDRPANVLRKWL